MAEPQVERRRSRTRPRSCDKAVHCRENSSPAQTSTHPEKPGIALKTKSSQASVDAATHHTGSTEQSYTMNDEYGGRNSLSSNIPLEVVVINDDEENIPSIRGLIVKEDVQLQLKKYETLLLNYKEKLKSSENLNGTLHQYLRQTQGYAENLLSERKELLDVIQEMEDEENRRIDQELLLKFLMCSSLFLYLFGGSEQFLVATVVLQLIVTLLNMVF
ncbi:unnamed protein product [Pseudo-nitzschia multistriata]|uniref:Uncharacterized protein n=1 Tax=Pseudo-nitzschia multistriata TaxID=183589 RepID=A0A448ZQ38_9STRA|nr:unnamed protein product [Pseudo-nitzschia multistriata]